MDLLNLIFSTIYGIPTILILLSLFVILVVGVFLMIYWPIVKRTFDPNYKASQRRYDVVEAQIDWYKASKEAQETVKEVQERQLKQMEERDRELGILKKDPEFERVYKQGVMYQQQNQYDPAIAEFKKALSIDPNSAFAHQRLGTVYLLQGKYQDAINEYRESLELSPNDANTHFNLGLTYEKQGIPERAVHCYHEALDINPNHTQAIDGLDRLLPNVDIDKN